MQIKFDLSKRTASLINRFILFLEGELPTFFLTEIAKRLDSSSVFLNFTPIGPRDLYTPCLNTSRITTLLFSLFILGNELFSCTESFSTFGTSTLNNSAPSRSRHTSSESVFFLSPPVIRLEGTFHGLLKKTINLLLKLIKWENNQSIAKNIIKFL